MGFTFSDHKMATSPFFFHVHTIGFAHTVLAFKCTGMSAYVVCFYLIPHRHNKLQTIFYVCPATVVIIDCPWRRAAMTRQDKQKGRNMTPGHWSLMPEAI